jgi:hypothetical protein
MSHYNMAVFPALVLPLVSILGLERGEVLALSFWQYLLFGLTALPWGLAGDRWGGKPLMILMFLGCGLSGLAAALWIDSPWGLSLALAGVGLFSGTYHPIGLGLISKGIKRITMAMGYNAVFGGLGLVVAPLTTGIFNWLAGPRAAFLALALFNLLGLVLMALCPLAKGGATVKETSGNGKAQIGAITILLVAVGLAGLSFTGATVILPSYLELKTGNVLGAVLSFWPGAVSGNLLATLIASIVYLVGMIGQYSGGHVGERYDPRFGYLLYHAACIPCAFLMAVTTELPLAGLAMVYFFFLLGTQPCENTLVAALTPRSLQHSAFGLKFVLTFGFGALAVKIVAWIDSIWGVEAVFTSLGITSVLTVAAVGLLILWTNRSGGSLASEFRKR